MTVIHRRAMGALIDLARAESGLVRVERALLAGTAILALLMVLFLLGVDILGWFGVAPPAAE